MPVSLVWSIAAEPAASPTHNAPADGADKDGGEDMWYPLSGTGQDSLGNFVLSGGAHADGRVCFRLRYKDYGLLPSAVVEGMAHLGKLTYEGRATEYGVAGRWRRFLANGQVAHGGGWRGGSFVLVPKKFSPSGGRK